MLRLEDLHERYKFFLRQGHALQHHVALTTIFEMLEVASRSDFKSDLLQELERQKQILFAGTIIPRKGYETLLKGFALIAAKYPQWKIVFAGNGEIAKARSIAENLGILAQVEFLGWISGEKKEEVFQESSIYCLASNGEGFPMGVLDAWAYGVPCIVTPVGGIPDIIENGKNGLIFPVNDSYKLAEQLDCLIQNTTLRKQIVSESDKYVYGAFSVQSVNSQLDQIYSTL